MAKYNLSAPMPADVMPQTHQPAEAVNPETPEACAFALMRLALPLDADGRRDLLGLFAECLTAANGKRYNPEWTH